MSLFLWILVSTVAGGVLSVAAAATVAFKASPARIPMLISYAVGALLGAVFLEILPHAFHSAPSTKALGGVILLGLIVFFVLEKLVLWRHHHGDELETAPSEPVHGHAHVHAGENDGGRSGMMIMVGDTFHNFVDGVLIAASFLADHQLGMVTALAIIAHEIPQEVGDFLVLVHSGFSKRQALLFNLASSAAMVLGGVLGYAALNALQAWVPYLLGFVAAGMIYVSVADLIPGLHRRPELKATLHQTALIGLGIASIWVVRVLTGHID
jgi:zinc and cadmium transporter